MKALSKRSKPTAKEKNLIKGKINSIFARSELRRKILQAAIIPNYSDPLRPRVKTWVKCNICNKPEAASYIDIDHITPKIPVDGSFDSMSFDEYISRVWCDETNLQALCPSCHTDKSKEENKLRRKLKKRIKNE